MERATIGAFVVGCTVVFLSALLVKWLVVRVGMPGFAALERWMRSMMGR